MNRYFRIKEKLRKIFNYFSIFTIFLASFGSLNSARADNIGAALTWDAETGDAVFNVNSGVLTIIAPATNEATEKITGITAGVGITAGNVIVRDNAADINTAISGDAVMNDLTVDVDDDQTGDAIDFDLGDADTDTIAIAGDVLMTNVDTGSSSLLVTAKGVLTVAGTTTIQAVGGSGTTTTAILDIDDTATFTGAVTLNDGGTDEDGVAKVTVTANSVDTITFTGGFLAAADGEGELEIAGGAAALKTIAGNIGTTAVRLKTLDVNTLSTFSGTVYADTIEIDAVNGATFSSDVAGTTMSVATSGGDVIFKGNSTIAISTTEVDNVITYSGTSDQTQTGAITSVDDGDGIVNNANTSGTVTFASRVATNADKLKQFDSDASSKTVFNLELSTDLFTLDGTVTLTQDENDAVDMDFGASSKLILAKSITNTQNVLNDVATDFTVTTGAKIYAPINLKDGQALILLDGTDGTADDATVVAALNTAAVDSILIDYAVTADATANEADLTATYKSEATTASEASITSNQAKALKQAYLSAIDDTNQDSGAEDAFEAALLNSAGSYSATEDTALARQVAPQDELISGSTFAAKAMTGTVQGIMSSRMASLRSGDAYFGTGVNAAGEMMSANSAFIQIFGSEAEQDNLTKGSGIQYGYDTQTEGIAIGFDGINDNNSVFGISLSRSTTELVGKGTGSAKNDIDSYTVSLYMDKTTDVGYVEGSLTAGINENVTSRIVNSAGLSRTYKGAYDSSQLSLKIGGGVPKSVGGDAFVTPFGSVTGTLINTEDYTETSTTSGDNLRLRIAQDDVNSIVGTVGLKYHNVLSNGGVPMISLALNGELGDKTIDSTNTYQGGGTSFKTSTDVEELSATLGLGYTFNSDRTSVEIAYEADANSEDYLSHYGSFKIVGKF